MRALFLLALLLAPLGAELLPRKVIAIYDKRLHEDLFFTKVHQLAEMPLNHLGLTVSYYDVYEELPALEKDPEVIGTIIWFSEASELREEVASRLLSWLIQMAESGKRVVLLGYLPFENSNFSQHPGELNRLLSHLGLYDVGRSLSSRLNSELIVIDPRMVNFERSYSLPLRPYRRFAPVSDQIDVALAAQEGKDRTTYSCLVMTGPKGGYAAEGYANLYTYGSGDPARFWYIDPFYFFKKAFGIEGYPAVDRTTVAGRRVFYSHIDGDGWNNLALIREYQSPPHSALEVLIEEVLKPNPDLPVTVAPIAADIDPKWFGEERSLISLHKLTQLKHIELGNHTFTHPFYWRFFRNYTPQDEEPYLYRYPGGSWKGRGVIAWARVAYDSWGSIEAPLNGASSYSGQKLFDEAYEVPRAYALQPFDPKMEVIDSNRVIEEAAGGKLSSRLYQWSGDCLPFLEMFELLESVNLLNLNGGDNRLDDQFPSYSWVRPIGREVGRFRQIYASNSNENTYTDFWRGNFFAFNRLPQTIARTELPIRILPVNLYYHVYSGEKLPSLEALKQNIAYIKGLSLIPLHAREYVEIAKGFYTAKLTSLGDARFKVEERGSLTTLRFDRASDQVVDFSKSEGVVGYRHLYGSLYVYLDEEHKAPIVALKEGEAEGVFSLISSSMRIFSVARGERSLKFKARGLGKGEMEWRVPKEGSYTLITPRGRVSVPSKGQIISFSEEHISHEVEEYQIKIE